MRSETLNTLFKLCLYYNDIGTACDLLILTKTRVFLTILNATEKS